MADTATEARRAPRIYDVPKMVQTAMDVRGVNQGEIAHLLEIHQTQVSRRLRGSIPFNTAELLKVADFLDVDVEFFFQDPFALLRGGSTSARLSHAHLQPLPSMPGRRERSTGQAPLLTVVSDE